MNVMLLSQFFCFPHDHTLKFPKYFLAFLLFFYTQPDTNIHHILGNFNFCSCLNQPVKSAYSEIDQLACLFYILEILIEKKMNETNENFSIFWVNFVTRERLLPSACVEINM